jgi:type I restriction enzyme, S subunit
VTEQRLIDRLVEAPEAAGGLRKVMVGLALRNRLSAGEDGNKTSTQVLDGLAEHIDRPRGQVTAVEIDDHDLPPALPKGTVYMRLADLALLNKGATAIMKARAGNYPLVVTAAERRSCDHFDFEGPAAIVPMVSSTGHGHASLHRLHYQEGKFAAGTILCVVRPMVPELVSARFIYEYLTAFKDELLVSQMLGTANVSLTIAKIGSVPVPIVSSAIQRQVSAVMARCDQIEAAQQRREAVRDEFEKTAAKRLRVLQPDDGDFRSNARFYLDHLPRIANRAGLIGRLRQTIVDLAANGRMVPQRTGQPAASVIEHAQDDKTDSDMPLSARLPPGWVHTTLDAVTTKITDGAHKTPTYVRVGVPFVSTQDFSPGTLDLSNARRIPASEHDALRRRCDPRRGDVLIGRIGTLGKPVVVETDEEFSLFVSVGLIRVNREIVSPEFVRIALSSSFATSEFDRIKVGGGTHTNKLNLRDLRTVAVLMPPLEEQNRIVSKVAQLSVLCDSLERILVVARDERSRLPSAMLNAV